MKDLNLGPDSEAVIKRYQEIVRSHKRGMTKEYNELFAEAQCLLDLLERWVQIAWCRHDSSPAHICGGPHVQVRYADDSPGSVFESIVVVERYDRVGTTFPEVPHHVINLPRP